ncbi:MAG: DUF3987 domain-containing protein [Bacteroidaceae bacterium]|nr:DUF3987 domain-containing protein [Bacteroidaceae bacterium]MBR6601802.1 DUF3987 domain-containing protein [Bacteroidaceae bacterium]
MITHNTQTAGASEPQADHTRALLFTNGAYDKYCYPLHSLDELMQLTTSDHYQQALAAYRNGNEEAKKRMLALLPQARLKHSNIWLHTMEWLVPSGWVFLDDDRPATEITAEERHRRVEERLAHLGLQDMPHIALRSASMKYHLLVPMAYPSLRESWEHWREVFDGVLVLDPSTVNVNRLMFFTGELLTAPETLGWLLASPLPLPRRGDSESAEINYPKPAMEAVPLSLGERLGVRLEGGGRGLPSIAAHIVEQLCGTTTPPEGTRNNTLFEAAKTMCYIEGITEADLMGAFEALDWLGLPKREARQCIRSAMRQEKSWKYTLPPELVRAMETASDLNSDETSYPKPAMPESSLSLGEGGGRGLLPSLISLFTRHVPENARMAVSSMVFAPLGAYLNNTVTIRDVSNKSRNLQFTSVVVGNSSSGKGFVDYVSDFITQRLRQRDEASWSALRAWQEQKKTVAKGEPAPLKPEVPLRILSSNMTEPALLERLMALEPIRGRAYIKAAEIDELRKFQSNGTKLGGGQDIILSAFDTAAYGALRVSAEAVSALTVMSLNICCASTFPGTQEFFRQGVERGSVGRCDFSIVNDSFEVPLYKDFTPEAAAQLDLYLDRLENATGEIVNPDIDRLIEEIRLSYHDPASPLSHQQNPEYFKLCHRQLLLTKQKATILYICNDYVWDPAWEEWLIEAFRYGMQCKISIFAGEIASWAKRQCTCVTHVSVNPQKSDLTELPPTFTTDDLLALKRRQAPDADEKVIAKRTRETLRNWLRRGRITPATGDNTWHQGESAHP